jgi:DNA-binding response OmpR family regulator
MCRAVWVVVVGASEDACTRLRRAAGPDAQVVLLTTDPDEVLAGDATFDVVVVDGSSPGAAGLVEALRAGRPGSAIVWVGDDAPEQAHQAAALNDGLDDSLPGAITKALIARGAAGRTT